jgi:DNA-binding response OmpR family regulator
MLLFGFISCAHSYIAKPFRGRELVARVHLQMQLGKRRAELEVSQCPCLARKSTTDFPRPFLQARFE